LAGTVGIMRLAVLVFCWISGVHVEEALAGLLEEGLVVEYHIVPDITILKDLLEVADEVLMKPQYTVLVQSVIVLYRQLHQRQQQQFH
jgi:hypothetical protein